jgi:hypothetical protein
VSDHKPDSDDGGTRLPSALYTSVPLDLFRMGNASGPQLNKIRPEDVPTETVGEGPAAVVMVRAEGGISTFDGIDQTKLNRKWWCIPAGTLLPETLVIKKDNLNRRNGLTHYSIRPARYMTLLEFANGLRTLSSKATLVFTKPVSHAKSSHS